jgi:arabinoxylan arabinofuranohydrolase
MGNPLVRHTSAADPDAHVWGDTVWVYCSMDANLKDYGLGPNDYKYDYTDGYRLFSTTDMVNWVDHGEIFHSRNVNWGPSGWMWAPSAAWNGKTGSDAKYFLYYPHKDWEGVWRVGVATGPTPAGPFTDIGPINKVVGIDPHVFIDTDNQAYLYNNDAMVVKLKENLLEVAEEPRKIEYGAGNIEAKFRFEEGSYMHKRGSVYYYSYSNWSAQDTMAYYATGSSPYGPFKWRGALSGKKSGSQDHHSIIQFKKQWYYFYHMDTPWEEKRELNWYGQRRIACYSRLTYAKDNGIKFVTPTSFYGNAGGPRLESSNGAVYQWDAWYSIGNSVTGKSDEPISGTTDGSIYQTYRYGRSFSYDIPLANGNYSVILKFAEVYHSSVGRRQFSVDMEGARVITDLDVFAIVGKNKGYDIVRQVTVKDNELNISFDAAIDTAMVAGLNVVKVARRANLKGGKLL